MNNNDEMIIMIKSNDINEIINMKWLINNINIILIDMIMKLW